MIAASPPFGQRLKTLSVAFAAVAALGGVQAVHPQPADLPIPAATTDQYPPGVRVISTPAGAVYADGKGRVLYGMDMRTLLRWSPDPSQYCTDQCAKAWEPLLATGRQPNIRYPAPPGAGRRAANAAPAAGALAQPPRQDNVGAFFNPPTPAGFFTQQNAPDWTVIEGPQGAQWVYKGWHMVYVRRGADAKSVGFDGAEDRVWNTLKYVPPVPKVVAPRNVKPLFVDGRYVLATEDGRVLFSGDCGKTCSEWKPLQAAMASAPLGQWAVKNDADLPQWTYRGKPVFVSDADDPTQAPPRAKLLQP
jgi:predicted lipoprotein with Yx(FWY)xxD motif